MGGGGGGAPPGAGLAGPGEKAPGIGGGGGAPGIGGGGGAPPVGMGGGGGAPLDGIGGGGGASVSGGGAYWLGDLTAGELGAGDPVSMLDRGRGGAMVPKRIEARCLALPPPGRP